MQEKINQIKEALKLIGELKAKFNVQANKDGMESLIFAGVTVSNVITQLTPEVEKTFGKAYKPAGKWAFFMNFFDSFVKGVGGIRTDQTLFRKDIGPGLTLYCAFWPWGSNPVKTSIRIGLLCDTEEIEAQMEKALAGSFR